MRRAWPLLAVLLLAGCGGAGREQAQHTARPAPAPAPQGREEAAPAGGADEDAFFQLASAAGALSRRASVVVVAGERRAADVSTLPLLRRRVAGLHPADAGLAGLRRRLLVALDAAIRARLAPHSARAALVAADAVVRGLDAYSQRHPAVAGLVPD